MLSLKIYPVAAPVMKLSQRLDLECTVCGGWHSESRHEAVAVEAGLFGAKKYAVCLCCGGAVSESTMKNLGYKQRWTRFKNKGNK